jgi:DNA-binding GntR family transcriptional regulator
VHNAYCTLVEALSPPRLLEGRYTSKKDLVIDWLREAIITGEFQAGHHLRQEELAERLGVSITPVREALSELRAAGLLTQQANRGARVADTDPRLLADVAMLRSNLEPLAARLAAANLTPRDLELLRQLQNRFDELLHRGDTQDLRKLNYQIHMSIYRAAGSPLLLEFITQLWARLPWDILSVLPGQSARSLHEHAQLLAALEQHDGEAAERLTREHISHSADALLSFASERPSPTRYGSGGKP